MKRPSDTPARIWQAVRRIEARGDRPTMPAVVEELREMYGDGASYRDVSPVVAAWRAEQITRGERRIAAAVDALVELAAGHPLELEEVGRRFRERTKGDRLSVKITRRRSTSRKTG